MMCACVEEVNTIIALAVCKNWLVWESCKYKYNSDNEGQVTEGSSYICRESEREEHILGVGASSCLEAK